MILIRAMHDSYYSADGLSGYSVHVYLITCRSWIALRLSFCCTSVASSKGTSSVELDRISSAVARSSGGASRNFLADSSRPCFTSVSSAERSVCTHSTPKHTRKDNSATHKMKISFLEVNLFGYTHPSFPDDALQHVHKFHVATQ